MDKVQKSGIGDVCPGKKDKLELAEVREKLSEARGPQYWRTLDELAQTPEFEEMLHREFPKHASEWTDKSSRRDFMKIMGASLALAGSERLHQAAAGSDCALRAGSRTTWCWASRCSMRRRCRWEPTARACWWRATKAVRPRSKAIRNILPRWAEPMCSTRPAC